MNLNTLKEFSFLSKDLSFSKTAKRCYVSQSTLSRHIQALEKEVGVQLVEYDGSQVRMTPNGETFADVAKQITDLYDNTVRLMRDDDTDFDEILRIAYTSSITTKFIDKAYAMQLERHPRVKVELLASWEQRVQTMLDQGKADIAITVRFANPYSSDKWESMMLYEDHYVALVPTTHELASREKLTLDDLVDQTVLIPFREEYPVQYKHLSNMLSQAGIKANDWIRDKHDNVAMTNAGFGIALVRSRQAQSLMFGDLTIVPLDAQEADFTVQALWKKGSTEKRVQDFIAILEQMKGNGLL